MLPSTKRNLVLGIFLVIVTLVVLYSYCNGNSVCYTFPFFSGLERDRFDKPEVLVTSVIVQTKRPFDMETTPRQKGQHYDTSTKQSEMYATNKQEVNPRKTENLTGEEEKKLHFHQNITTVETNLLTGKKKDNRTQLMEIREPIKHLLPPSDIVGKVAEEILRKANVSEEEANREFIRVEKVDETVDREKSHRPEHDLLKKVKESRGKGGKNSEKKLIRVERVDLTDDEEEDEEEKPDKTVLEPVQQKILSRMQSGKASKTEDLESAHARRFGIKDATSSNLTTNASFVEVKVQSRHVANRNATMEAPRSTLPPFFAQFLNITAKERQLADALHNFTEDSKPLDWPSTSIRHQGNGTEKNPALAGKADKREKRNHKEPSLLDTLVAKLFNTSGGKLPTYSKRREEPFNLSKILERITDRGGNIAYKENNNSAPDSAALLVKFLMQSSRYQLGIPQNTNATQTIRGKNKIAVSKPGNQTKKLHPSSEGTLNLKKTLLELANDIDLNRHRNHSETASDQRNKTDLVLKLILHQSTFQDLTNFNLSHVLSEIAGNSLENSLTALQPVKVKREEVRDELSTVAPSDIRIFRPVADKLGTSTLLQGNQMRSSVPDSSSIDRSIKNHTSFSIGSGSTGSEDKESGRRISAWIYSDYSSGSEKRVNVNTPTHGNSQRKQLTNGILRFDKVSCDELDPKVLLYNRIFKTGSSTTESIIMNSSSTMNYDYKIGTTEDWYDKGESRPYPGLIIRKANKKLVNYPRMAFVAHFYFRGHLNLPQAHTYINQVRHPVRRMVSHYFYMRSRNRPRHRIKEFLASGEKNESLKECFKRQHKGCKNNIMTRFFCGKHSYCRRGSMRALHKAMHNIRRYYATVGILEHYEVYLQILSKRLPKFFPRISSYDISKFKYNPKYKFEDVPGDLLGQIKRANWADVKLYSLVKKRFWKQAEACGINSYTSSPSL